MTHDIDIVRENNFIFIQKNLCLCIFYPFNFKLLNLDSKLYFFKRFIREEKENQQKRI
jgi:hypothetical protein